MKTLKKTLELKEEEFFITHMRIVNSILPIKLTEREIEVLGVFMSFTGTIADDRFCTQGKKIARNKLNMSTQSLHNFITNIKNKKLLIINKFNNLDILPILFPSDSNEQTYNIILKRKKYDGRIDETF
jgi:hypothetical protein